MCSASSATISSESWDKPRPVGRSAAAIPGRCNRPLGTACRRQREPKGLGCMTGATSNSPMSRLRKVHERTAYTAYSIREIYRAENSPLTLMASERIDGMVRALLQDYAGQGGVD
jgi:hypothetical protein